MLLRRLQTLLQIRMEGGLSELTSLKPFARQSESLESIVRNQTIAVIITTVEVRLGRSELSFDGMSGKKNVAPLSQ